MIEQWEQCIQAQIEVRPPVVVVNDAGVVAKENHILRGAGVAVLERIGRYTSYMCGAAQYQGPMSNYTAVRALSLVLKNESICTLIYPPSFATSDYTLITTISNCTVCKLLLWGIEM